MAQKIQVIFIFIKALFRKLFSRKPKEPTPKFQWSPFVKYPRNEPCYCGSGLKYKRCHRDTEELIIPEEIAVKAAVLVKDVRKKRK